VIQLYDINVDARDEVYRASRLDLEDWKVQEQMCAALSPFTDSTTFGQGTKYPTLYAYYQMAYTLLDLTKPGSRLLYDLN
jgi:hypothetical protein